MDESHQFKRSGRLRDFGGDAKIASRRLLLCRGFELLTSKVQEVSFLSLTACIDSLDRLLLAIDRPPSEQRGRIKRSQMYNQQPQPLGNP
jgi:hypothetical protein